MSLKKPRQRSLPFTMMYFLLYNVDGVTDGGRMTTAFKRAGVVSFVTMTKEVVNMDQKGKANIVRQHVHLYMCPLNLNRS